MAPLGGGGGGTRDRLTGLWGNLSFSLVSQKELVNRKQKQRKKDSSLPLQYQTRVCREWTLKKKKKKKGRKSYRWTSFSSGAKWKDLIFKAPGLSVSFSSKLRFRQAILVCQELNSLPAPSATKKKKKNTHGRLPTRSSARLARRESQAYRRRILAQNPLGDRIRKAATECSRKKRVYSLPCLKKPGRSKHATADPARQTDPTSAREPGAKKH